MPPSAAAPSAAGRLLLGRCKLDVHQLAGHVLAQAPEHIFEQDEAFRLVLVQRIELPIGAEADHLTQMFERHDVLAPQMVERLQQNHFLDLAIEIGAKLRGLCFGIGIDGGLEALSDLFVSDAFLGGPGSDRKLEAEYLVRLLLEEPSCPTVRRRRPAE